MKHCFVIPAYKDSPFLEECILSIINQSVKSTLIITTSTPSDYKKLLAEKYQLSYVVNPILNAGIAGDWNFALQQADGDLITLAHQDDIYETTYAEKISNLMRSNNKVFIFTDYSDSINGKIISSSTNIVIKKILLTPFLINKIHRSVFWKKFIFMFGNPVCCPSVTLSKSVLQDFTFSNQYSYIVDWSAWYQMAGMKVDFLFVNEKLMQHRIHNGSETTAQMITGKRISEELFMFQLMWGNFLGKCIAYLYRISHKGNKN
jgi:glycosyltransferase involved in cell wall biosynthesis